jgi:hypothetical protein
LNFLQFRPVVFSIHLSHLAGYKNFVWIIRNNE